MNTIKKGDYVGHSEQGIGEAIGNALEKVGDHSYFEVIETRGSQVVGEEKTEYQVTISAFVSPEGEEG